MNVSARAKKVYPRSPAMQGAYKKGARAAKTGLSVQSCPYRGNDGWSRGFRRAWTSGYQAHVET